MLIQLINHTLKKYFDHDPEVAGQLQALEGKPLACHVTDLNREFLLIPGPGSVEVAEPFDHDPSQIAAHVHAPTVTWLSIACGAPYQPLLEEGAVQVEGDLEAVKQMGRIFRGVEIDWEEVLAPYVGDVLAHQLGTRLTRARRYGRRSLKNFLLDVSEYLQEESRVMPARAEMQRFLREARDLEVDLGDLQARIERLDKTGRR